jgi:hypothetical protein
MADLIRSLREIESGELRDPDECRRVLAFAKNYVAAAIDAAYDQESLYERALGAFITNWPEAKASVTS